ncbi:MAG TPA: AraC family transcriptional regulator [Acidimicrobiia bacterium]
MERLNRHSNDELSELLRAVNVHSSVYCVSNLRAPWGFRVADSAVAKFHLLLEGSCVLTAKGEERIQLHAGEFVLLPHGDGHVVKDRRGSKVQRLERILADHDVDANATLEFGGRGRRTRLVCGGFALGDRLPPELVRLLPLVVRLDADATGLHRWIEPLFAFLHDDTQPGAAAVFSKIADVFLTQTLRSYLIAANEAGVVGLAHLSDPAIAKAVELLRDRPDGRWTVADLARDVGMSRSRFSARFGELVGETPMRFLSKVRLTHAAGLLITTNDNLYTIARAAGYESEASFSKAFKRSFGRAPGEYRRERSARPIEIDDEPSF